MTDVTFISIVFFITAFRNVQEEDRDIDLLEMAWYR